MTGIVNKSTLQFTDDMGEKLIVVCDSKVVFCILSFNVTAVDLLPVDPGHTEFKILPVKVFVQFGCLFEHTAELPLQSAPHSLQDVNNACDLVVRIENIPCLHCSFTVMIHQSLHYYRMITFTIIIVHRVVLWCPHFS